MVRPSLRLTAGRTLGWVIAAACAVGAVVFMWNTRPASAAFPPITTPRVTVPRPTTTTTQPRETTTPTTKAPVTTPRATTP
jgi:hypothetical protein